MITLNNLLKPHISFVLVKFRKMAIWNTKYIENLHLIEKYILPLMFFKPKPQSALCTYKI